MKSIILAILLAGIAHALPSPPAAEGNEPAKAPPQPTPKVVGELPKEGLKTFPYPNFDGLASLLGFDPAKATPDGNGAKCQSSPNGRFCFSSSGGSFSLGHPGGAFDGEKWNPFEGPPGMGTAGGLLAGAIGEADDIA